MAHRNSLAWALRTAPKMICCCSSVFLCRSELVGPDVDLTLGHLPKIAVGLLDVGPICSWIGRWDTPYEALRSLLTIVLAHLDLCRDDPAKRAIGDCWCGRHGGALRSRNHAPAGAGRMASTTMSPSTTTGTPSRLSVQFRIGMSR